MADNNNKKKGGQQPNKGKQAAEKVEQPKQAVAEPVAAPTPAVQAQPVVQPVEPATEDASANANKEAKKEKKPAFQRETGRGIVKAVPSGDTILVVVHNPTKIKQGPPEEKEITISNINAPRLGRRKSQKNPKGTEDEPFAWASRDYLRKRVIGKPVSYVVEYATESKSYGVVHLLDPKGGSSENLAKSIVSEGWAKVRAQKELRDDQQVRPDVAELLEAQQEAAAAGKGVHNKDNTITSVRKIATAEPAELFEQWKGQTLTAFVDQVITGSRIRVLVLPSFHNVTVLLSGCECPDVTQDGHAEPFGREAKFFVEHFLLHRDVQLVLEGMDKFNLYGNISLGGHNIAEELLRSGLAKYVDWSGNRSSSAEKLRAAERAAKEKKQRLWSSFEEPKALSRQDEKAKLKAGKEIIGKVSKIVNAGAVKIVDNAGREHEVFLSSVRLPFSGNPVPQPNEDREVAFRRSLGWEGKEYLRRRLIGQRVRAVCDYIRSAAPLTAEQNANRNKNINNNNKKEAAPLPDRAYYSVYLDKNNVAVELVDLGYASAQEHRAGEPRTKDYEEVLFAEQRAKKAQKGVHTKNMDKAAITHINDLSRNDENGTKAKQFFPFLKRLGRARGVVEYVFSAGRLKIYVPKESCQINLILSGVSVPRQPDDPFYAEASAFANEKAMQRDIEFEVLTQDKRGNFIGNIWVGKDENLATMLLEQGLAYINYTTVQDNPLQTEFVIAEESAKKKHVNVWADYDEVKEAEERAKRQAARNEQFVKPQQEFIDVTITEIVDATKFYVQIANENAKLDELMKQLSLGDDNTPYTPEVNELVKAQFTADDAWYRARVLEKTADGEYAVFYVDYGNTETVPVARIRELKDTESTLAPQAKQARLAYVAPPAIDDDYGPEAAEFFRDLVWGKTMMANVESRDVISKDSEVLHLSLGDRESQVHVNAALVRAGLARVERVRSRHLQPMIEKLREEESKARADHSYIWEYGDPGSDDEDETPFGRRKPGAPAPKK